MNTLGVGFLEKVYENALAFELRRCGLQVIQQKPLNVYYEGVVVGEYVADLLVENAVIVELKVAKVLDDAHVAQCVNYLKATGLELALLLNFATREVGVRRVIRSRNQSGRNQ
ncbi:MAG: GxxExxY protein [Caldilineaceae bacterium]|nr:GxxExxY protein [Caldilineaceae bacterium]